FPVEPPIDYPLHPPPEQQQAKSKQQEKNKVNP
ncbi:unnamed protein product, partial [marine sediment metagenome]